MLARLRTPGEEGHSAVTGRALEVNLESAAIPFHVGKHDPILTNFLEISWF